MTVVLATFFAGMEVLLIFVIRGPYQRGVSWPVTLVGVLAAVLLIIGYVSPFNGKTTGSCPFGITNR